MVPMERDTRTDDLHVFFVVLRSSLTRTEWTPVRFFEMKLTRVGDSDWPAAGTIPLK